MRSVACLVLATLLVAASPAAAGRPPGLTPYVEPAETETRRYGYQVFLADVGWLIVTSVAAKAEDDRGGNGLSSVLALGYFVAAPAVHHANGNSRGAWQSLGARTLMPLGGAVIGMAIAASGDGETDEDGTDFAVLGGMLLGGTAGLLTALIVDYTVIAKKEVEVPREGTLGRMKVRPGVKISRQSFAVSVGGSF